MEKIREEYIIEVVDPMLRTLHIVRCHDVWQFFRVAGKLKEYGFEIKRIRKVGKQT